MASNLKDNVSLENHATIVMISNKYLYLTNNNNYYFIHCFVVF